MKQIKIWEIEIGNKTFTIYQIYNNGKKHLKNMK